MSQYGATDANLLCVTHGGLLRTMLPLVLANADRDLLGQRRLPNTACIVAAPGPGGLRCLEWDGAGI